MSGMIRLGFRQHVPNDGGQEEVIEVITRTKPDSDDGIELRSSVTSRDRSLLTLCGKKDKISPLDWYRAIQNDKISEYTRIMEQFSNNKVSLLQGRFVYQADEEMAKLAMELKAQCPFETSFILACAFGSKEVLQKMLHDGVDARVRERSGVNFVHALIHAVAENRDQESMFVDVYTLIMDQTPISSRREILSTEDRQHYHPLELAVRKGTYGLFKAIIETIGVYKDSETAGHLGIHTFVRYDISEYDNFKSRTRELRSPLRLMCFLDNSFFRSYLQFDIHSLPVVKRWREKQIRRALPIIAVWYVFKLFFISAVMFLDSSRLSEVRARYNTSSVVHPLSLGDEVMDDSIIIIMGALGALGFIASIVLHIKHLLDFPRREVDKQNANDSFVIHTDFYSYVQFFQNGLVCGQVIAAYAGCDKETLYDFKAVLIPFCLLTYLQIFTVVPYIDRFVISLQRMVVVLIKFAFIHTIVRLVYTLFLMNSEVVRPDANFSTIYQAFYGVFLLDLSEIRLDFPFYLQFTHLTFFYISGVLLINYLIAIMSDMTSAVNSQADIFCHLTKLELAFHAQETIGRYIWRCFPEKTSHLVVKTQDSNCMQNYVDLTHPTTDKDKNGNDS